MSAEKDVEINHKTLNAPVQLIWCFPGSLVVPDLLSSDSLVFGKLHGSPEPPQNLCHHTTQLKGPCLLAPVDGWLINNNPPHEKMGTMSDLGVVLPTLTLIASPGQLSAPNMVPLLRSWQLILAFPSSLESGRFLQCRASSQCK